MKYAIWQNYLFAPKHIARPTLTFNLQMQFIELILFSFLKTDSREERIFTEERTTEMAFKLFRLILDMNS